MDHEERAKQAEYFKDNPIFGTDLNRPLSEIIREIRNDATKVRDKIDDFQNAYPWWKERTEPVNGLLTCGIVTLYYVLEQLEKFEKESQERK